jgi:hypothetical protein
VDAARPVDSIDWRLHFCAFKGLLCRQVVQDLLFGLAIIINRLNLRLEEGLVRCVGEGIFFKELLTIVLLCVHPGLLVRAKSVTVGSVRAAEELCVRGIDLHVLPARLLPPTGH